MAPAKQVDGQFMVQEGTNAARDEVEGAFCLSVTSAYRSPAGTERLDDYLNAIEKALCEPAPDEDTDFVFENYEMAIMQAMEPHILEQTWSPLQTDEGKAGACEKLAMKIV
ncbi:hypothetical protein E4U58_001912 [Claviceps cyperi]|nr:hypothetical protein E4U58_001912 [Claviceps cyperi]